MTEIEWAKANRYNRILTAIAPPTESQLAAFNLACCRRIRHLIDNEATLAAMDALEASADDGKIRPDLALAANHVSNPIGVRAEAMYARKAIAHAVCRSLPVKHFCYCSDQVDNSRLVAFYTVSAVEHEADSGHDCDHDADSGLIWIRSIAETEESAAICDLVRAIFERQT
jgi:hypothetical protein